MEGEGGERFVVSEKFKPDLEDILASPVRVVSAFEGRDFFVIFVVLLLLLPVVLYYCCLVFFIIVSSCYCLRKIVCVCVCVCMCVCVCVCERLFYVFVC